VRNFFNKRDDDDLPSWDSDTACEEHDETDCDICAGRSDPEPRTSLGDHIHSE
jgi:hypothetical protein